MTANLTNPTEQVSFDLEIDDQFIHQEFSTPNKYKLLVTFFTCGSGIATNVSYKIFNAHAGAFKWDARLFNYIQHGAECHSKKFWTNVSATSNVHELIND